MPQDTGTRSPVVPEPVTLAINESQDSLASDEPIADASQDLLGRVSFARALARTVERAPHRSGFVIAVTGAWGDGKTSVLNMAVAELRERKSVEIVRFNPWLFSGTEDLLSRFFSELAAQLPDDGGPLKAVSGGLRRYAQVVAPFRSLPWVGGTLQATGEIAHGAAGLIAPTADSAHQRAKELRGALRRLEKPIMITVDDIDRLRADEVADVMRLVRLVGDFPNLVYVLAFERERVEEALGGGPDRRAAGQGYLEKIVQAIFEMPALQPEALQRVLLQAISDAVGDVDRLTFSRDAYVSVYAQGLRGLFASLRDVRRFGNALPAAIELIGDEVELSDVLALEALRLLEPEVFAAIAASPDALTMVSVRGFGNHDVALETLHRDAVTQLLQDARRPSPVRKLITELFPAARRHLGGSHYGESWQASWRRERRVATREILDIYLAGGLPPGALPNSTVRELLEALDDRARLDELLSGLDGGVLERLFARLEDYEGRFETEHPETAIGALLDVAGRLRTGRQAVSDVGADIALTRLLLRILRGRPPEEVERAVAAVETDSLWGRYELVLMVGYVEGAGHRMVSDEAAGAFERALTADILSAPAELLRAERDVAALMGLAYRVEAAGLRSRLTEWTQDPRFLIALLRSATLESVASTAGRADVRHRYQLSWPRLADMAGQGILADRVRAAASALGEVELDEIERQVFEQAQRYADDPELADEHIGGWGTTFDD